MTSKIESLLKQPEGKTLEFKRDLSSPRNFLKTLVAFANSAGGKLIFGVDDKSRQPLGIDNPLDEEERLCSLIADSVEPKLVPHVELITISGKTLLMAEVFLSNSRPHWISREGSEAVYVRLGSTNRRADRELIAELKRSADNVAFDELPKPHLTVDDIDLKAVSEVFNNGKDLSEYQLLTLKLLVREQGRLVPTNGAILLYGKQREQFFPDAWVQCARFRGKSKATMVDHIEIHDHLTIVVEQMMSFLKKHAMQQSDFSDLKRKDTWNIPLTILREAIVNAVVHADYSQIGSPIRLAFFDNRIEID
ncbi:putative DNA binding domain-containing protein, partial [bacterium]|nr:putative DNA binding domain-containing protein [bacterium]